MAITRIFDMIMKKIIKHWGHYLYIIARKRNIDEDYQESFELFVSHTDEKQVIERILEQEVNLQSIESCLDIGGGNALLVQSLNNKDKVLVVEPNKNFVDNLRSQGFRCICAKWENVDLEERFDLILAAYVTTYFPKSRLKEMIVKMIKHLNIAGKLVILAVDEEAGSWRETHTYFYNLINLKKVSSTVKLKKTMAELKATEKKFITKVYADSVEQMIQILTFDFCKYGSNFEKNKGKLRDYLKQYQKGEAVELEMVHWMFIVQK